MIKESRVGRISSVVPMCDQVQNWRNSTIYIQWLPPPCFSAAAERAKAGHPLPLTLSGCHLQFELAKDAVKALYKVHGMEYIFGSISTTLCK